MDTFELDIFIDCKRDTVYDHLAEPINMIGLQPRLIGIDTLTERRNAEGVVVRPFHTVEMQRLLGLPLFRSRVASALRLTKPGEELELSIHSKPDVEVVFNYRFRQFNDGRTQVTLTVRSVQGNKPLANLVLNRAKHTQRVLLSNLKVRLEKH